MSLLVVLALCSFICAAILAGMAKNWPVALLATGLALPTLSAVTTSSRVVVASNLSPGVDVAPLLDPTAASLRALAPGDFTFSDLDASL